MAELARLLTRHIIRELNSYDGLISAKIQLWHRVRAIVREQYPDVKWNYNFQRREWESHPLQRYIKLVEMRFPLPELTDNLSIEEWIEYLIWKGENHQGIKEWKRYGRHKGENIPKGNNPSQAKTRAGTRAYVPSGKTRGPAKVQQKARYQEEKEEDSPSEGVS